MALIANNLLNNDTPGRPGFLDRLLKLRVFRFKRLWPLGKRTEKAYRLKYLKDYDELFEGIKAPKIEMIHHINQCDNQSPVWVLLTDPY